ncbi:hypothetical protein ASD8599_02568 [Ascidiaceihabitans donghaensis]|uniref:Uncharacterized protein n=1 Tax=Ascidiaceihabitans donghaensis TaxID=1510460 RepID=A0A2R8BFN2_9RHOB|nr:hypothetical protein ASD8599_02568 [Ascidiaceihabitans donghaensis]
MIEIILVVLFLPVSLLMMFAAWCALAQVPEAEDDT